MSVDLERELKIAASISSHHAHNCWTTPQPLSVHEAMDVWRAEGGGEGRVSSTDGGLSAKWPKMQAIQSGACSLCKAITVRGASRWLWLKMGDMWAWQNATWRRAEAWGTQVACVCLRQNLTSQNTEENKNTGKRLKNRGELNQENYQYCVFNRTSWQPGQELIVNMTNMTWLLANLCSVKRQTIHKKKCN